MSSIVSFSPNEIWTEDQIINFAVARNTETIYAKLQEKYDVFKTKVPLFSDCTLTAKIGLKEGLVGGEKFEVLKQLLDLKTGIVAYKKIGIIEVDKKMVWDNRFSFQPSKGDEGQVENSKKINETYFETNDDVKKYAGMLIRQLKKVF